MNELTAIVGWGVLVFTVLVAIVNIVPMVVLSEWFEERMRERAVRAQAYYSAVLAARAAYEAEMGPGLVEREGGFASRSEEMRRMKTR